MALVDRSCCSVVLTRYLELEESPPDWSSDGEQSDEEGHTAPSGPSILRDQQFVRLQHTAYFNPVRMVLERINALSMRQFNDNASWLAPLLTRVIICENASVRGLVKACFQHFVVPVFAPDH